MSTLAFFPWFSIEEERTFGQFHLIPYERGKRPAGAGSELQAQIDAITKPYVRHGDNSITTATLLKSGDGEITRDIIENELPIIFTFAELFACAGLSAREFFSVGGFLYSNRDTYRLSIQNFQGLSGPTTEFTRRRDGSTQTAWDPKVYRVHRPKYIAEPCPGKVDDALLIALLNVQAAPNAKSWGAIYEAVLNFNLANTDSDYFTREIEVILSISAFERLAGISSGKEAQLADSLRELLKPIKEPSV